MSQANILVFDTATIACTVALKTKKGISSRHIEQANCHSQYLLDMIQQLLSESEITLSQIDYLVVGVGPGSFTGLRIGIGIAQSLAYTNNITLLTMSTLEFIAVSASSDIGFSNQDSLIVAHDARMHEIYMASYSMNFEMKKFELMHPIKLFSPDQLNNQLNNQVFSKDGRVFLCGNAWKV